ncbi:hypothetical protein OHD62_33440 [Mesorhizobium sp. YC-39]|uniref:hypothetical protein n=1 Tax=unclassified Mesorhizobium TaxID=325217 RepID=UPI0021E7E087|nr:MULTISPECIES: hypothetical protein [unclassified Mesorhizobium]MCV3211531.1 hypothetical protein [Mesorhizobium sp. YC-2]MCV3233271.1 hypothetical protein [Mesorhizobium sp. YC-39]
MQFRAGTIADSIFVFSSTYIPTISLGSLTETVMRPTASVNEAGCPFALIAKASPETLFQDEYRRFTVKPKNSTGPKVSESGSRIHDQPEPAVGFLSSLHASKR